MRVSRVSPIDPLNDGDSVNSSHSPRVHELELPSSNGQLSPAFTNNVEPYENEAEAGAQLENGDNSAADQIATDSNAPSHPPLPAHLSNLPPEARAALEARMRRELAIDEARNRQPRRRIDRNAKQLYCAAFGTTIFLILLLIKKSPCRRLDWFLVFSPLSAQYFILFYLTMLEAWDIRDILRLQLNNPEAAMAFATAKTIMSKFHEALWHLVCLLTSFLLAAYLERHNTSENGSLFRAMSAVWLYGAVSLSAGILYFIFSVFSRCHFESAGQTLSGFLSWGFALLVRVAPVALIVHKLENTEQTYPWVVAFIPLWISAGVLAIMGFLVWCMVPLLVLTQDAAGRVLGGIMAIAALFMIIPAVCSLAFLILLCQKLCEEDYEESCGNKKMPLYVVLMPLFVMYFLLTILTPVLVRVVNYTHNILDAMQQNEAPHTQRNAVNGTDVQRKRPGMERKLSMNTSDEAAIVFVRQTSTFFRRVVAGEDHACAPQETLEQEKPDEESITVRTRNFSARVGVDRRETEMLCYVCCENKRDAILQPCGHGGMCYECSVEFVSTPQSRAGVSDSSLPDGMPAPHCPLCRNGVTEVLRLSNIAGIDDGVSFIASTSWMVGVVADTAVGSLLSGVRVVPGANSEGVLTDGGENTRVEASPVPAARYRDEDNESG